MGILFIVLLLLLGFLVGLQALRWSDARRVAKSWVNLERLGQGTGCTFDPSSVEDLPEPARRYFLYTMEAGAPISTVTDISMSGEIGLGTKSRPNYLPMQARQVLAPPYGLVWNVIAGRGQPTMVVIPRWSDANPEKTYQLQPFGGFLSEFRNFDGYTLPTRVEGGNFIGTEAYFPFYKARVDCLRFKRAHKVE